MIGVAFFVALLSITLIQLVPLSSHCRNKSISDLKLKVIYANFRIMLETLILYIYIYKFLVCQFSESLES